MAETSSRTPVIASQAAAVALGVVGLAVAAWAFYDAYERRGATRPMIVRWMGI